MRDLSGVRQIFFRGQGGSVKIELKIQSKIELMSVWYYNQDEDQIEIENFEKLHSFWAFSSKSEKTNYISVNIAA